MARTDYTDDELELLTDDERAALLDDSEESGDKPTPSNADGDVEDKLDDITLDEKDDTDAAAAKKPGGEEDKSADKDKDDGKDKGGDTDTKIETDDGKKPGETDTEIDGDKDKPKTREQEPSSKPLLKADAPEDAQAKLDEIATKKSELADQFDNGDLTSKEYMAQIDALNKEERRIENAVFKAELAQEMNQSSAQATWENTVNAFMADHQEYAPGSARWRALNSLVMEIAASDEAKEMTGRQILVKAHESVESELGKVNREASNKDNAAGKDKAKNKGADKEIPPTLGGLPAASGTETETNKFTYLDRLADSDPQRYEHELARLSVSDREQYLSQ